MKLFKVSPFEVRGKKGKKGQIWPADIQLDTWLSDTCFRYNNFTSLCFSLCFFLRVQYNKGNMTQTLCKKNVVDQSLNKTNINQMVSWKIENNTLLLLKHLRKQ